MHEPRTANRIREIENAQNSHHRSRARCSGREAEAAERRGYRGSTEQRAAPYVPLEITDNNQANKDVDGRDFRREDGASRLSPGHDVESNILPIRSHNPFVPAKAGTQYNRFDHGSGSPLTRG